MVRARRMTTASQPKGLVMNLPKIDVASLPDLDTITGVFGSLAHAAHVQSSDDSLIVMMVFVYEFLRG